MKSLIVILNVLMAGAIVWAAGAAFAPERPRTAVVKRDKKSVSKKTAPNDGETKSAPKMSRDQQIAAILSADMFNSERTPNATSRFGGRMEMSLVGTFEAGKIRGAVILQRTNSRQMNPFMRMMWGGAPGGMPGGMPGGRGGTRSA